MAAATTQIATALGNLYDGLAALEATTLTEVDVVYGPDNREPERTSIFVHADPSTGQQVWAAIGGPTSGVAREETFQLRVVTWVVEPGSSYRESFERCVVLAAVVESYVRTNHQLGLNVARVPRVELLSARPLMFPAGTEGAGAAMETLVRVRTRI